MRRRNIAVLFALFCLPVWSSPGLASGEYELFPIHSRILESNPLHDSPDRLLAVFLPPGYENGTERYPVAYYLMGYGGRVDSSTIERYSAMAERIDSAIVTGAVKGMIVVIPDCATRYGGSQYRDSPAQGRYESYLVHEVVPYVDEHFRTIPSRDSRALFGHSSGGYGALVLGMHHPDLFGAVASLSGDAYFDLTHQGFIADFIRENPDHEPIGGRDTLRGVAPYLIGLACAYSPDPDDSTRYELPFDYPSGEMIERVWNEWLAHDPINMVNRYEQNLRRLRGLYIYAGRRDEFHLDIGARVLEKRLGRLGIRFTSVEDEGTHGSHLPAQQIEALKFFSHTLAFP